MKTPRLSFGKQLILNLLWFALNAETAALLTVVIPTQVLLFEPSSQVGSAEQATLLSWLATAAAIVSLFMPPLVGAFSDRTPGRLGRRRPYIILGGVLLVSGTPLLVDSSTLVTFLIGLALLHFGMNIIMPAYQSLVPDRVPEEQRGVASGFVGGLTILGNVASLGLAAYLLGGVNQIHFDPNLVRHNAGLYYMTTATIITIVIVITVLGVQETPYNPRLVTGKLVRERTVTGFIWWLIHHWVEPWR